MKILRGTLCAAWGALAVFAHAQVVVSLDFEGPSYGTGPLSGQDGWVAGGAVSITGTRAHQGTQSVQVGPTFDSNCLRQMPGGFFHYGVGTFWYMQASMYVTPGQGEHVAIGLTPSIGGGFLLGLDNRGGIYYYTGTLDTTEVFGSALQNTWVDLRMEKASETMVRVSVDAPGFHFSELRSFSSVTNGAQNLSISGNGIVNDPSQGWVDDVKVGVVPEPTSLVALAMGLLALRRRRPKS